MPIKKGEAYVLREDSNLSYAVVVEGVEKGVITSWDTGSCHSGDNFKPQQFYGNEQNFLERYQLATQEQLDPILADLRERLATTSLKINLLERAAQSQPSESEHPIPQTWTEYCMSFLKTTRRIDATKPGYSEPNE